MGETSRPSVWDAVGGSWPLDSSILGEWEWLSWAHVLGPIRGMGRMTIELRCVGAWKTQNDGLDDETAAARRRQGRRRRVRWRAASAGALRLQVDMAEEASAQVVASERPKLELRVRRRRQQPSAELLIARAR